MLPHDSSWKICRMLADYTIHRHYPELVDSSNKYLDFLRAVIDRQAALIAQWQLVGFIHGVMNTDNMAISGETIDYGPCAFMNVYRPETVFSSIDHSGRYAYRNQPAIAQWNLTRFAETLLPLLNPNEDQAIDIAKQALGEFAGAFQKNWLNGMRRKLGLQTDESDDANLIQSLLDWMYASKSDFTNTFRDLSEGSLTSEHVPNPEFQSWLIRWEQRLGREGATTASVASRMQATNPAIIPRNHRVEEALSAAEEQNDLSKFNRLLEALLSPYNFGPDTKDYREPSPDDGQYQTFCGT